MQYIACKSNYLLFTKYKLLIIKFQKGLIIHGPSGVGKTTMLNKIA